MKFNLIYYFLMMSFFSCNTQTKNNTNIPVDIGTVKVSELPFTFSKNNIQIDSLKNQEIENLFSDSTILNPPFLYTDHPNNVQGKFYKRLPDIGSNRVLLFAYFNSEWLSDGMNKTTTMELQIFNENNLIVDKMIVADGVDGDCSWHRTFEINENYEIHIENKFSCLETNETKGFDQTFRINDNGNIVEFFSQSKGDVEFCNKIPFLEKRWYSKGYVENHLKQGRWIECEYIYDADTEEYKNEYFWNIYRNGVKVSKPTIVEDEDFEKIECLNEE